MDARRRAERRLARTLLETQPASAAAVLEDLAPEHAAEILREALPGAAAGPLSLMTSAAASAALEHLSDDDARDRLAELPPHAAATVLRRMPPGTRERLVAALPPAVGRAVQALLAYPEGTAGALADPRVLAFPPDLTVRVARTRATESASHAHYNLYVVERDGVLVGVLNLRELFASPEQERLAAVMNAATHRIPARAERLEVIAHPGWRQVHSLPVVDDAGRLVGAIRFRTLRGLEEEAFRRAAREVGSTGSALGELYWTGVSGMLDALLTALAPGWRGASVEGDEREPRR